MRKELGIFLGVVFGASVVLSSARAQEGPAIERAGSTTAPFQQAERSRGHSHRFWDATNVGLFAGVGTVRALDYTSTQHFRARGVDEWLLTNDIVDNKPLFIGVEVAGMVASLGVSYLLHRSGHHRLERWISVVHIGVGTAGSARNYTLDRRVSGVPPR